MKLLFFLFFFLSAITQSNGQKASTIALKTSRVFDSEKGQMLLDQTIIIKEGIIMDMGRSISIPQDAEVIDLTGFTVLPGLIEAHNHLLMSHPGDEDNTLTVTKAVTQEGDALRALRGAARAKSFLDAGYTTVRDLGNSGKFADVALKRSIAEGSSVGPRLYVSGPGLSPVGGQAPDVLPNHQALVEGEYRVIRGVEDARMAVRENIYYGVDVIKLYSNSSPNKLFLSAEEMKAIVEEAHLHGVKVTAHATNDLAIKRAIEAGVNAIEHAYAVSDEALLLMKKRKVTMVPTDMDFLLGKKQFEKLKISASDEKIQAALQPYHERLQRAIKFGVMIAAGSDMYMDLGLTRGEAAKRVLFAYKEAGMNNKSILQSATLHGANLIGEEKLGRIKKGSWADIVAINGNPMENLSALENVVFVMKAGEVYKPIK